MNYSNMLGGLVVVILSGIIAFVFIDLMKQRYAFINTRFLKRLFFYHLFLSLVYYGYILFNPSDSRAYYEKVVLNYRGESWSDFYGTSTTFIEWIGYPFIKYFACSFQAVMAIFSFFGFLGFVYFYIFFKENIRFNHYLRGYSLVTIIFFLPNLHFWSASFGKGAVIFLGIGLFFYGLSNVGKRILAIAIGGLIIYHVRPHVMLVILVSSILGFIFSSKGISVPMRVVFLLGASVAFFFIYKDVLRMVGIDQEEFISQGLNLTHRARELSKATSGVNITQYALPMQVFTFLYRPLFFDAPGVLGIIVSFENVFYLLFSLKLFKSLKGISFLMTGNFLVKSAFLSFLTISIALAQIAGNLGLAMRQKSQVMILLLFVVLAYMDAQKMGTWKALRLRRQKFVRTSAVQKVT